MGCVFCFVLTGHHPFENEEDGRQLKIQKNKHSLSDSNDSDDKIKFGKTYYIVSAPS